MVSCSLGVLLEMELLDLLPSNHDPTEPSKLNPAPNVIDIPMVDHIEVVGLAVEGHELVTVCVIVLLAQ